MGFQSIAAHRWAGASIVVGGHATILAALTAFRFHELPNAVTEVPVELSGFVIAAGQVNDVVPAPEPRLRHLRIASNAIRMVRFESPDWGNISGVIATASAPQLSRFQPVDLEVFARRAGLAAGQALSVVLTVEVLTDGRVGRVELSRGSGNPAVDEVAVAYARLLRWIPGTHNHHAEAMRVSLPVTLVWNG